VETGFPSAGGVLIFVGLVVVGLVVLIGAVALLARARANTADRPPDAPAYTQATVRIANPIDEDVRAELLRQLQRGNKIQAIKLLREYSGLGLKEAKDAVEALERSPAAPLPGPAPARPAPAPGASPDDDPEVRLLLQRGNKIAAVKRVRELTGWGLKESKDYVDRL
jgi:ribosomal protein L7/L12